MPLPAEYLAADTEDAGGRDQPTYHRRDDRAHDESERGRVLPYGNVAHDNASNPASPIDVTVRVPPSS
ncbi:MAG TPA: hypothetical protein VFV13_10540 [Acidimicrobiia bacterium]|nr:hypothetical protein [Acidimicrobiia bacterium]